MTGSFSNLLMPVFNFASRSSNDLEKTHSGEKETSWPKGQKSLLAARQKIPVKLKEQVINIHIILKPVWTYGI